MLLSISAPRFYIRAQFVALEDCEIIILFDAIIPVKFRKQKPIGNFIVDFYCSEAVWCLV